MCLGFSAFTRVVNQRGAKIATVTPDADFLCPCALLCLLSSEKGEQKFFLKFILKIMTNLTPTPNPDAKPEDTQQALPSPLRCLSGALISGGFAFALYLLTSSISQTFAGKPIDSTNPTAINIAIAVRTLVVGLSALATAVFSLVTLGLVALAIQISVQQLKNRTTPPSDV